MALFQYTPHNSGGFFGKRAFRLQGRDILRFAVPVCLGLGIGWFATSLRADDYESRPVDDRSEVQAANDFDDEMQSDDYDIAAYQPRDGEGPRDARRDGGDRGDRPGFDGPSRGPRGDGRSPDDFRRGPPPGMRGGPGPGGPGEPGRDFGPPRFERHRPRDGGPPGEVIRLLHELRDEVARLNREIQQLRAERGHGPERGPGREFRGGFPGDGRRDFRGPPGGPGPREQMRGDGREVPGRGGPTGDRRGPDGSRDERRGPDSPRFDRGGPDGGRGPDGRPGNRRGPDGPRNDRRGPDSGTGDRGSPDGPPSDRPRSENRPQRASADEQPQPRREEITAEPKRTEPDTQPAPASEGPGREE